MGRRRGRRGTSESQKVFAVAFGLGLFLSLFCSPRFALCLAAVALIWLGIKFRP